MKKLLFSIAIATFLLASCKNDPISSNDVAIHSVPADVSSVTAINIKQILDKADFEGIQKMDFYQKAINESKNKGNVVLAKILNDPSASGVNLEQNAYFFNHIDPKNPENIFSGIIFNLNDASAFAKLMEEGDVKTEKLNGYTKTEKLGMGAMAWNEDIALLGNTNNRSLDINEQLNRFFNTTEATSVSNNKDLQKALAGNHDITNWITTNSIAKNPQAGFALSMINVKADALQDNSIHSTFDFEKGAIVGRSNFYFNNELGKNFIGKFFKDEVKTDFGDYLPAENLIFATAGAIDFTGIDQFLSERPQVKGYVDYTLKNAGLTMQDVIETFGGDLLLAGMGDGTSGNNHTLFASNIKDKSKLNAFIDLAIEQNLIMELEDNVYKIMTVGAPGFSFSKGEGFGKMFDQ